MNRFFIITVTLIIIISLLGINSAQAQQAATLINDSGVSITENSATATAANGWGNAGFETSETLAASTDGYIEFTPNATTKARNLGLSATNTNNNYTTIDYSIRVNSTSYNVFESGTKKWQGSSSYSANDVFRVERIGTTITYSVNGSVFYTSDIPSSSQLVGDAAFHHQGGILGNITIDFGGGACSTTVYADTDGDGFGDPNSSIVDCTSPAGYVEDNMDCDDTDGAINPNTVWYQDNDGDDFGNPAVSLTQCDQPDGYVLNNTDCDDTTNDPTNNCGGGGATVWTESGNDIRYSDGKVFIGNEALDVSSDDYNLFVEKGIMTERLKVAIEGSGDWADYVFADDYQRVKIAELEAFIKANKHLPNVPSAQEVADKGIDVAKMDATLLQQIEEIWLHVIDLKKENEALKQQIKDISKK